MTGKEKIALLEELLELEEGSLSPDKRLAEVEEYDSMAKLSLIVMMDEQFGAQLDSVTVKGFETVADIIALMD